MTNATVKAKGPIVLLILDGWGLSPAWRGNAIAFAGAPTFARLWRTYPHGVLRTADRARDPRLIDSELQHATLGSGRWVRPDLEEITDAINRDLFSQNTTLREAIAAAADARRTLHLIGIASHHSIDADLRHLEALLRMCQRLNAHRVVLHLITEDAWQSPEHAVTALAAVEQLIEQVGIGTIASVVGRAVALPSREPLATILPAYRLWVQGRGLLVTNLADAIRTAYRRGATDGTLPPLWRKQTDASASGPITEGDVVVVWNGRGNPLAPIVRAFLDPRALRPLVRRQAPLRRLTRLVTLVRPTGELPDHLEVAFPPAKLPTTLGEIVAGRDLRQLRIARPGHEAAVTRLFSGGRGEPYPKEERLILPAATGNQPLSDALGRIVNRVLAHLERSPADLVVWNIDEIDRAAHTGDLFATAAAVRMVDQALEVVVKAVVGRGDTLIITSDHGNAEAMLPDGPVRHTASPVPFLLIGKNRERNLVRQAITLSPHLAATLIVPTGGLPDIAPTVLELLGIPVPIEMTGQSLLDRLR